jgi:hypothetical protein
LSGANNSINTVRASVCCGFNKSGTYLIVEIIKQNKKSFRILNRHAVQKMEGVFEIVHLCRCT